jgi:hypothetical protein
MKEKIPQGVSLGDNGSGHSGIHCMVVKDVKLLMILSEHQ